MDRSPQCTAQVILEMGPDSSRQHLFQNTLRPPVRSHHKSALSNYNTSNLLVNPARVDFWNPEDEASPSTGLTYGASVLLCRYPCPCGRTRVWTFHRERARTPSPFCYKNGPKRTHTRRNSPRRRRINPKKGLSKALASDSCSERMTPPPTATYDSPN